ncbi:hypothetical protein ATK78_0130 [Pedobacter metabolipauper]|uniref:Uncharacterized protein n=2 Tax=Pedobacter metabolipauper TaxID=425513 RepID=A0A4R6SX92_9SPHI|nr:hypothetical protein ATK78_0130 [Pedobacter metabolipauper]
MEFNYSINTNRSFANSLFHTFVVLAMMVLPNPTFGQKSLAKKAFVLNCKQAEKKWKLLSFEGYKVNYFFLNNSYKETDSNGVDSFTGTVLMDIDKNTIDSLTGIKMCYLISKKLGLEEFTVFRTCQAYKIYISSTGYKNEDEKTYLINNYFGTYIRPLKKD